MEIKDAIRMLEYRSAIGNSWCGDRYHDALQLIIDNQQKQIENLRAQLDECKADAVEMAHHLLCSSDDMWRDEAVVIIAKHEEEGDAKNTHTENT